MTINERQELEILGIIFKENITSIYLQDLPRSLTNKLGGAYFEILKAMCRDGFLIGNIITSPQLVVSPLAKDRYRLLKEQADSEKSGNNMNRYILTVAVIGALAAIVSVVYAMLAYYHPFPSPIPS